SAFLYGTIKDEVYVCQPPGSEDPDYPNKVYKVVKALYGLRQAPKAWLMKDKFQMSSLGELTFFLGLQVKQKKDGIFISQDKYVAKILRKFGLTDGKSASTPIDTEKPLLKDPNGEDVDVDMHTYRSIISSLMYLTSSRPDIMFADKISQALELKKLKQRVKKLEKRNKASKIRRLHKVGTAQRIETSDDTVMDDASKQRRIIVNMDADKDVTLKDVAAIAKDDEAYARELEAEINKNIDWDEVIDHVQRKEKEDNVAKRADGSPQLFLSFLSLLRNFDREDLEVLWELVKERFASSKPKNFSDDFLLTTLTYMFEKPDVQAQVWKNQTTVHGLAKVKSWGLLESCGVHINTFTSTQMILLVKKRYPSTRLVLLDSAA
nr:ribonuclease H-like domain, reverse transcriptase, RNA-dependent DNA polymerase [Tanacetum cinerariifolium]